MTNIAPKTVTFMAYASCDSSANEVGRRDFVEMMVTLPFTSLDFDQEGIGTIGIKRARNDAAGFETSMLRTPIFSVSIGHNGKNVSYTTLFLPPQEALETIMVQAANGICKFNLTGVQGNHNFRTAKARKEASTIIRGTADSLPNMQRVRQEPSRTVARKSSFDQARL